MTDQSKCSKTILSLKQGMSGTNFNNKIFTRSSHSAVLGIFPLKIPPAWKTPQHEQNKKKEGIFPYSTYIPKYRQNLLCKISYNIYLYIFILFFYVFLGGLVYITEQDKAKENNYDENAQTQEARTKR